MNDGANTRQISSSMLAKRLNMPIRELFGLLQEHGWINRSADSWRLTRKGEFEGGRYRNSERYGTYIAWPQGIIEHRIFVASPEVRRWSAAALAYRIGLSSRVTALLLREMGWTRRGVRGWLLTPEGEAAGGEQAEDPLSGVPEVYWPPEVLGNPVLEQSLGRLHIMPTENEQEPDLFDRQSTSPCTGENDYCSIDGHRFNTLPGMQICQWLYLSGLAHACNGILPVEGDYRYDFFLPEAQVYIEYWGQEKASGQLADKLACQRVYEQHGLAVIDLRKDDLSRLDEVLPRALLRYGFALD